MQPKAKKPAKKEQPLFTEDERNTIPFVRAVSNKIRNVNKKLSDIADLEAKPADQLKPEQKEKISKKQQLLDENQKFQEILRFYKQIENERKESEVSEAHKLLHLSALVSLLTNQPESLFERKILTKEEAKLFQPMYTLHGNHSTMKERLDQTKVFVKDYLKNEGLQAIVDKTVMHKDFGSIEVKVPRLLQEEKHASKVTSKPAKKDSEEKTVVVTEAPVHVERVEPKVETLTAATPASSGATAPATESKPVTITTPAESAPKPSEPAVKKVSDDFSENAKHHLSQKNTHRSRGADQFPVAHRNSEDKGHFTREERAELDKQGFIIVDKPQKVASKHSAKQFGPSRDSRQYHQ